MAQVGINYVLSEISQLAPTYIGLSDMNLKLENYLAKLGWNVSVILRAKVKKV